MNSYVKRKIGGKFMLMYRLFMVRYGEDRY